MIDASRLRGQVAEVLPSVVELRRAIHQHPELAYQEFGTTDRITSTLRRQGLSPRPRTPKTGLIVDIGAGPPAVGFRTDLDALPISEPPGLPFASEIPGLMHACGHDAHAAVAAGLAMICHRLGADLLGRVRFVFQPAEETFPGGAYELVREGAVDGLSAIIAFHVDPTIAAGKVGLRAGAITASTDRFFITLEGPGGHTARPHRTVDLIHAAGKVVIELPALLDRLIDARSPFVLVFGRIGGGSAENVIPTAVDLSGTARTLDRALWEEIPGLLEKLVHDIVSPTGAKAIVHYQRGIPPVLNDEAVINSVRAAITEALGTDAVAPTLASMGAEDFARYLDVVPGALLRLGGAREETKSPDLHSAAFELDERALETGLLAGSAAILGLLKRSA